MSLKITRSSEKSLGVALHQCPNWQTWHVQSMGHGTILRYWDYTPQTDLESWHRRLKRCLRQRWADSYFAIQIQSWIFKTPSKSNHNPKLFCN